MKLKYLSFIACILLVLAGCTKDATVWERAKVNEVKLLSFGFYKADNPHTLLKDYVLEKVNAANVSMLLPASIDKSNLVARFTVGDNDVIKVNGVIQKSGETANDFTVPVDYFLSDGNYNAKYTVTITKGGDYIWTSIPFTINDSATNLKMKVNPVTGEPVILYYQSRTPSDNNRLAMLTYEAGVWDLQGVISDGRTGLYDFTFNSAGVPFVGYMDYTTSPAQKYTVKTLSGDSWSLVGAAGITPVKITHNAIAFDAENRLKGFSMLDAVSGDFLRREMSVSTFDNGSWTISKITPRPGNITSQYPSPVRKGNALYVGIYNSVSTNSFSLYKWSNDNWTTLLEQYVHPNQTAGNINDFDIDVDEEGNVFIATIDNSDGGIAKLHILKYNAATQAVTTVGNYINATVGGSAQFDLELSPIGIPYVLYKNPSGYPTVISFDEETQDWSAPFFLANETGEDLWMDFAPNGEAYVAYKKGNKIFIHKYTLP